jgi:hypothetical protein
MVSFYISHSRVQSQIAMRMVIISVYFEPLYVPIQLLIIIFNEKSYDHKSDTSNML